MAEQVKRYWHYTAQSLIDEIIQSQVINVTQTLIDENERPAVWFSTNPLWEHTVTKRIGLKDGSSYQLNFDEMVAGFGLARIEIRPTDNLISWQQFKLVSGISIATAKHLEDIGRDRGANPSEWYASFEPIAINYWGRIEVWVDNEWLLYD